MKVVCWQWGILQGIIYLSIDKVLGLDMLLKPLTSLHLTCFECDI